MKFDEAVKKISEELIKPNKEIYWEFSNDYTYAWMVIMKKDHLLIAVDGPPIKKDKKPDETFLKRAVKFTKHTVLDLLKSMKKRLTEEEEGRGEHGLLHGDNIVAKLQIPFEVGTDGKMDYDDVVKSKKYAKEIIEDSKFLYERHGVVSLEHDDFVKYGIIKKKDYNTEDDEDIDI